MDAWLQGLGLATAVLSAVVFYAGSAHCLWPRWRGWPRLARGLGSALTVLSLVAWMQALGAAGACAMLACWMLALVAQPWLALLACRNPLVGDALKRHRPQASIDRGVAEEHRPQVGSYNGRGVMEDALEEHRPQAAAGRGVVGEAR